MKSQDEFNPAHTAIFFAKGGVFLSPQLAHQISELLTTIAGDSMKSREITLHPDTAASILEDLEHTRPGSSTITQQPSGLWIEWQCISRDQISIVATSDDAVDWDEANCRISRAGLESIAGRKA